MNKIDIEKYIHNQIINKITILNEICNIIILNKSNIRFNNITEVYFNLIMNDLQNINDILNNYSDCNTELINIIKSIIQHINKFIIINNIKVSKRNTNKYNKQKIDICKAVIEIINNNT